MMRTLSLALVTLILCVYPGEWRVCLAFRTASVAEPIDNAYLKHRLVSHPSRGRISDLPLYSTDENTPAGEDISVKVPKNSDGATSNAGIAHSGNAITEDLELCDEISDSFMKYALSIILGRALPDARDGLKVVHRRILWAMHVLKLGASTPYRKCAKVVGDVLGKYHPHSDKSVYDALCRLAQKFMMRVQLVDGHGNFGSTDDPPAAMRYTECRLSHFSEKLLLPDIASETVDMLPNFDSTELEPTVLPSKVPMLLINGSSGIAVGLATSIPPHNPDEIITAAILMAKNCGEVDSEMLLHVVRGPDFPTGGHISTTMDNLRKIYTTGKGSIMLQAKFSYEERIKPRNSKSESDIVVNTYPRPSHLSFSAGSRTSIIVTELPYNVRLRDVMLSISKGVETGTLRGISDLRDESDRSGIRLVIDLKKHITTHIEVEEIMEKLKRMNGLCSFFKCNFIALDSSGTKPVRLTLHSALKIWLDFRVQTIRKRSLYLLKQAKERLNVVRGFITASNYMEEIVRMIRDCSSSAEARKNLTDKRFGGLNNEQASAVMRMTLSQLSRMEREKLETEESHLKATIERYNKLLHDERNIFELIALELQEIQQSPRKLYSNRRRSTSMSVSGRQKVPLSSIMLSVAPATGTSDPNNQLRSDEDSDEDNNGGADADLSEDDGISEEDCEDVISTYKDPSLIVINNLGWIQRVKLDNMFFTSGRARSIYSPKVYQEQASQYSIGSGATETDTLDSSLQERPRLHYGLSRPDDIAVLMSLDGICLTLPVAKLRLCSRGYSLWKSLQLTHTERIGHVMITDKLKQGKEKGANGKERRNVLLANPNDYLVVGFSDGILSLMRGSILQSKMSDKSGVSRVRLWRGERGDPVFSTLAGVDDDIFVATATGKSIRVRMKELVSGMESRSKTQMRVIQLSENDKVTCGALLEGPTEDEENPEDEEKDHNDEENTASKDQYKANDDEELRDSQEDLAPCGKHIILLSERGKGKLIPIKELKPRHYGGTGYDIMRLSDGKTDTLVAAVPVVSDDHVLLVSRDGLLAQKDPFALRPGLRHHKMRNFWSRISGNDGMKYAVKI